MDDLPWISDLDRATFDRLSSALWKIAREWLDFLAASEDFARAAGALIDGGYAFLNGQKGWGQAQLWLLADSISGDRYPDERYLARGWVALLDGIGTAQGNVIGATCEPATKKDK